jgi:hypothetical protein
MSVVISIMTMIKAYDASSNLLFTGFNNGASSRLQLNHSRKDLQIILRIARVVCEEDLC